MCLKEAHEKCVGRRYQLTRPIFCLLLLVRLMVWIQLWAEGNKIRYCKQYRCDGTVCLCWCGVANMVVQVW